MTTSESKGRFFTKRIDSHNESNCELECSSADLHMAQLMPVTVSCFAKIQIGFTFLVPFHLGSAGKEAIKRV